MPDRLRARFHRPTPATAIALIALFVALGGTGYAALKLPKNSVGTKQLKANAVTGAKVKNGTLTADDFGGSLPTGAQGPKGDTGAAGTNGTNGTNGAKGDKGDQGDKGNDGTNGTGTQGPTGPSGTSLKPKVTAGPLDSGAPNTFAPLNVPAFTPAANKAELVLIKVDWTTPAAGCTGTPVGPGGGQVIIKFDGTQIASQQGPANASTQTLEASKPIISSASPAPHTVSVEVGDNCAASENATINTVTVERVELG
jgi:hypothetical protein